MTCSALCCMYIYISVDCIVDQNRSLHQTEQAKTEIFHLEIFWKESLGVFFFFPKLKKNSLPSPGKAVIAGQLSLSTVYQSFGTVAQESSATGEHCWR